MWYLIDDQAFYFTTLLRRATPRNLQRDPRVAFVIDDDDVRHYRGALVTGHGELAPASEWVPLTRAIARRYLGEADGERYASYMLGQAGRVVFRVAPAAVTHWGFERPDSVARLRSLRT
jgi:nitroimidazol reductase NimA-like FMN-containing flavoprotein (pyridoxamine 5'-phosphate oxidase superfamily)